MTVGQSTEEQTASSLASQCKGTQLTVKVSDSVDNFPVLDREWIALSPKLKGSSNIRVLTWNMLAQCLVRRDLFPTSDCLKANQRDGLLRSELLRCKADIICLQEVDRLEKLLPALHMAGYAEIFATGPGKRHGCMIAYRESLFKMMEYSVLEYDKLDMREEGNGSRRKASSRLTRNIALMGALVSRNDSRQGYLVATTHLFWHPAFFTYERIRQMALLLKELRKFRERNRINHWPCIIAGDFNFPPSDPAYSFLVGEPLTPQQKRVIEESRVVHVSIDVSIQVDNSGIGDDELAVADPDRVITNSRPAIDNDGLLSDEELANSFHVLGRLRSMYEEGQRQLKLPNVFGSRNDGFPLERKGYFEPQWTSYTHFWKSTLDYIFVMTEYVEIAGFLGLPSTQDLEPGLPRKGISGSDHISLVVDIDNQRNVD